MMDCVVCVGHFGFAVLDCVEGVLIVLEGLT